MSVPNSENILGVGNYVYSLLGAKLQLANQILSSGSGGVVPSPSGASWIIPYEFYHEVTADEAGEHSLTLAELKNVFGVNTVFIVQSVFQKNVGFTFSSNTTNGTLNFDLTATSGNDWTLEEGQIITFSASQTVTT